MKSANLSLSIEDNILNASRIMVNILAEALLQEEVKQITVPQFRILDMAHNLSNKPTEIARMLNVSPPAITFLLERLEEGGLLKRRFSAADRRRVEIFLTEKGEELLQRVNARRRKQLRKILQKMDPQSRSQLEKSLKSFNQAYMDMKRAGS
jgi:DNA-binding MarR family transcriptional regulator